MMNFLRYWWGAILMVLFLVGLLVLTTLSVHRRDEKRRECERHDMVLVEDVCVPGFNPGAHR